MIRKWKFALLLLLPIALLLGLREQQSWKPQVIYKVDAVSDIAISPDGKWLATCDVMSSNNNVTLVETQSGVARHQFAGATAMCFSPDSTQIVVYKRDARQLTFYDVRSGKARLFASPPRLDLTGSAPIKLVWSPKSERVIGLGYPCFVIDTQFGQLLRTFRVAEDILSDVELSPDASFIAGVNEIQHVVYNGDAAGPDGIDTVVGQRQGVRLWNVNDGKLLRTFDQKRQSRYEIAFSHDGQILASDVSNAEITTAIQLWNPQTGKLLKTLELPSHVQRAYGMKFSPTENLLAYTDINKTILIQNAENGVLMRQIQTTTNMVDICFSPDGKYLFTAQHDGTITRHRIR